MVESRNPSAGISDDAPRLFQVRVRVGLSGGRRILTGCAARGENRKGERKKIRRGKGRGNIPNKSLCVEGRTLFWHVHSRDRIHVVGVLHVAHGHRTGQIGHGHGVETLHGDGRTLSQERTKRISFFLLPPLNQGREVER
jgi:hypothetical protein